MLILAFDTATPATTVAVHDGDRVLSSVTQQGATKHGELLAPAIAEAMAEAGVPAAEVSDVAVGVGPGPFTGLRVGVVTARTLAASWGVPVHGVCTLDVIAAEARESIGGSFAVATDARRKEVYWAWYEPDGHRVDGPGVLRPHDLVDHLPAGVPVVGRGAELYADVLEYVDGPSDPDAGVLAAMIASGRARVVAPDPLYLRRPDAVPPGQRKRTS